MPELPEVETTVRGLNRAVLGRKIEDVWSDWQKIVRRPREFAQFKKDIKGRIIKKAKRRGKNILISLSGEKVLLVHLKMTGHLLAGNWTRRSKKWVPLDKGPLEDPVNRFIHLLFWLDGGRQLALSDLRKFAKAELWNEKELKEDESLKNLGQEPLEENLTLGKFKEIILRKKRGKIKQVLMDQSVIAGIGNIYSDEILWQARVSPLRKTNKLGPAELVRIYKAIPAVLKKAIKFQGDSMSDYRLLSGEKGRYQNIQKVYRQEGRPCPRKDGGVIAVAKLNGRSAHFCSRCQR